MSSLPPATVLTAPAWDTRRVAWMLQSTTETPLLGKVDRSPLLGKVDRSSVTNSEKMEDEFLSKYGMPLNPFWNDVSAAMRVATLCLIVAVPMILPRTQPISALDGAQKWLVREGFVSQGMPTVIVLAVMKDVGGCVMKCRAVMLGTISGSIMIWFMFGVLPEGVQETGFSGEAVFGSLMASAFILCVLWCNFSPAFKILGLAKFSSHWMSFMKGQGSKYCNSFQMPWDCVGGSTTAEYKVVIMTTLVVILVPLTMLIPWPRLALKNSRHTAITVVRALCSTWDEAVELYCAERRYLKKQDVLVHDMNGLRQKVEALEGALTTSWWECFGMGPAQRSRIMLNRMDMIARENFDRLQCVLRNIQHETFDEEHVQLMAGVKDDIKNVMDQAKELYCFSTMAALDGDVDEGEGRLMHSQIEETKRAVTRFSEKFRRLKRQNADNVVMNADLLDEHAFCYNVCCFARFAHEYAESLLKYDAQNNAEHDAHVFPKIQEAASWKSSFDVKVMNTKVNLMFVFRNGLSYLLCFFIGFHGFQYTNAAGTVTELIKPGSFGIAKTSAILMSASAGSSLVKNMSRLQGCVLACCLGQILYGLFARCTIPGYVATGVSMWLWVFVAMFIFFHSVPLSGNSMVGVCLAAFGAPHFVIGCDQPADATRAYQQINDIVVCIFIMATVDLTFTRERASVAATNKLTKVFHDIGTRLNDLANPEILTINFKRGVLAKQINGAEASGNEANVEPRIWRTPWKHNVFQASIQVARELRRVLVCMESTVSEEGKNNKNRIFMKMLKEMPEFQEVAKEMAQNLKDLDKLFKVLLHEDSSPFDIADEAPFQHDHRVRHSASIKQLVTVDFTSAWVSDGGCNANDHPYGPLLRQLMQREAENDLSSFTLEEDPTAQMSFALSSINCMLEEATKLQHTILQA